MYRGERIPGKNGGPAQRALVLVEEVQSADALLLRQSFEELEMKPIARVRRHRTQDEARIAQMMLALDSEGAGIRATNPANIARTFAHLRESDERGAIGVACAGDELVGYALIFPLWSAEYGGLLSLLDELWVEPGLRSRGIGALLMRWVEEEARRRSHVAIAITVMNHNSRAHEFYRRLGYGPLAATSFDKLLIGT